MRAYITVLDGDADLVPYFVRHYSRLGATLFPVVVYTSDDQKAELNRICNLVEEAGGSPLPLAHRPAHRFTARRRETLLRNNHPRGQWGFFADLDEYAELTPEEVSRLINTDVPYIYGHWLDRVAKGGKLANVEPGVPLEETYSWSTQTRQQLGYGDSAYILSKRGPQSHHPHACKWGSRLVRHAAKVPIHHFKWQGNVLRRLRRRIQRIEAMPASPARKRWKAKVARTVEYLERHGGGVDPSKLLFVGSRLGI